MLQRIATGALLAALSAAPAAAAPAGWQTYHDARGFSVSFPADWKANPNYYDQDYPTGDEPARLPALAIAPTGELQPGTTLFAEQLHVAILPLPPSRTACVASGFIAEPPPDYNSGFDVDRPEYAHLTGGDPGGWYTFEDYVWRLSVKPCFAVHYAIAYYAEDSEQARSLKPFDRAKLLHVMDAIRASVVLDPAH